MYIRHSNVSVPVRSGVTWWYQSLGSHIHSTTSRQIKGNKIFNWNALVLVIQSNYKYRVVYFDHPSFDSLIPSIFYYSDFCSL